MSPIDESVRVASERERVLAEHRRGEGNRAATAKARWVAVLVEEDR